MPNVAAGCPRCVLGIAVLTPTCVLTLLLPHQQGREHVLRLGFFQRRNVKPQNPAQFQDRGGRFLHGMPGGDGEF